MKRREFLKYSGSNVLLLLLACKPDGNVYLLHEFGLEKVYLRPPGALPEARFLEGCINCFACAEACAKGAVKFFTESLEGDVVADTPYIVASENACNLCLKCMPACPTGVLEMLENPEDAAMGFAFLKKDLCLPFINRSVCGACYSVCPLNAVELDMQRYPKVITDKCVGCGLCEEVCPVKAKAIRVFKT